MDKSHRLIGAAMLLTAVVLSWTASSARAQAEGTSPATAAAPAAPAEREVNKPLVDLWDNLLHFILVARVDLAKDSAEKIIQSTPDVRDVYALSARDATSAATLARGRGIKELADPIDQINRMIEQGAQALRQDPVEIARWIGMLAGPPRHYIAASDRLAFSGEYAVPQLVSALTDVKTSAVTRERIVTMLPRLGKDGVRPLCAALAVKDPAVLEVLCQALGAIRYRHAAPYLKELSETQDLLERTRTAAVHALAACDGQGLRKSAAGLYLEVAMKYYRGDESVSADSRYDTANVWYWQEGLGLTYKVVPAEIFDEIYAMRCAQSALRHDPSLSGAVTVWLAANLRKEAAMDAGVADPLRGVEDPAADFYALSASARNLQSVLAMALEQGDTPVAVRAISALARTTGAQNLLGPQGKEGFPPLVQALTYPAREVRCRAAETLALARPTESFAGSHLVVPVLIEALRQTGKPMAVLADPDQQRRNVVKDLLRQAGLDVTDGSALGAVMRAARDSGGFDLVVLSSGVRNPDLAQAVALIRGEPVISRTPIFLLAGRGDTTTARDVAKNDPLTHLLSETEWTAEGFASAIQQAAIRPGAPAATQPATEGAEPAAPSALAPAAPPTDEAAAWAIRAAGCLKMLAETRNPVYDLTDATKNLVAAVSDKRPTVRVAAAEALSMFPEAAAQQAIVGLAGDDAAPEEVRLAGYAALSVSVRQFGNRLTDKQAQAIVDTVLAKGSLKIRDGAAQVLGALALASEKIKDLILTAK